MRKFRVWCKNNNEWEKHPILIGRFGEIFQYISYLIPINPETHILQWCLEIKDINGKDIYEGDILTTNTLVHFIVPNIQDILIGNYYYDPMHYNNYKIEGNIFENPEIKINRKG